MRGQGLHNGDAEGRHDGWCGLMGGAGSISAVEHMQCIWCMAYKCVHTCTFGLIRGCQGAAHAVHVVHGIRVPAYKHFWLDKGLSRGSTCSAYDAWYTSACVQAFSAREGIVRGQCCAKIHEESEPPPLAAASQDTIVLGTSTDTGPHLW